MVSEHLELLLITYNRADDLRSTLERLAESPFGDCRLTVLDNHSTDATPQVIEEMAQRFPDLHVIRHPRNIGGTPNYLRALEVATKRYAWVVADDDDFDFSLCDDVLAAVEEGEVDLIALGAPGREDWSGGRTTLNGLRSQGRRVFYVFTFIPNTIYRTELIDDLLLYRCYEMVPTLYPHFAFLREMLERDATVHVSNRQIVLRRGTSLPSSHLWWFVRWVRCCQSLPDKHMRREAIWETNLTRRAWLLDRAAAVAQERLYFPARTGEEIFELLRTLRGAQRAWFLLLAPLAILPVGILRAAKGMIKGSQGASSSDGPPPDFQALGER